MKFKLSNVLGNYIIYLKNKKEAHLLRPEEAKTLRSQMLPDDVIPNCKFYLSKIHEDIMANKDLLDMFDYTESEKQKIKDTLFANELTDEQFNELLGYLIKENKENFNTERISLESIFMDNVMKDENTWTEIIHLDEEDFNESLAGLDKVYKVNFKTYDSEPSGFTVEVSGPKENVKHFIITEHDSNYEFEEEEIDDLGDWITEGKNESQDLFIQLCLPTVDVSTNLSIDASQLRSLIQQLSDNSGDFTHIEYYRDFAFTDVTAVNFIDNLNALELIIRLDEKAIKFENCDYEEFETILSTFLDVEGMEENYLDNSNFKEDNSFHDDDEETDYEWQEKHFDSPVSESNDLEDEFTNLQIVNQTLTKSFDRITGKLTFDWNGEGNPNTASFVIHRVPFAKGLDVSVTFADSQLNLRYNEQPDLVMYFCNFVEENYDEELWEAEVSDELIKKWLKEVIANDFQLEVGGEHYTGFLNTGGDIIDEPGKTFCKVIVNDYEKWNNWCLENLNLKFSGNEDEVIFEHSADQPTKNNETIVDKLERLDIDEMVKYHEAMLSTVDDPGHFIFDIVMTLDISATKLGFSDKERIALITLGISNIVEDRLFTVTTDETKEMYGNINYDVTKSEFLMAFENWVAEAQYKFSYDIITVVCSIYKIDIQMVEIEHSQYVNAVNQRIHEVEVRKNPYKIWHGYNGGKGLVDEFDEDYNTCMIFEFITGTNKFKIHEFEKPQEEGITDIEWSPSEFSYVDGTFYELEGYTDERADFNNNGWRITEELKEFLEENIDNMETKFPLLTEDELDKINNIIGQPLVTLEWLNVHLVQIDKIDSDQANDLEFLIERIATHVEDYIDYDLFFDKYNRYEEWVENDYDNTMFFSEDEDEEEVVDYDEMDDDEILSSYENFVGWYNNWAANFDSERIDFVNVSEDKFDALLEVTNRINGGLTAVDFAEIIETISNK